MMNFKRAHPPMRTVVLLTIGGGRKDMKTKSPKSTTSIPSMIVDFHQFHVEVDRSERRLGVKDSLVR